MITDRHREIANDIHNQLKSVTTLPKSKVESIGGEVYEVLDWLIYGKIINKKSFGYTKGQNFITYSGLDNLLNPPKEIPTVKIEYKSSLIDKALRYISLILALLLVLQQLTYNNDKKIILELEDNLSRKSKTIDTLSTKVQMLDSLLRMEKDKSLKYATDSLKK